jgi:hypothetical protein
MEAVDDLDGVGEMLLGVVPDPGGTVSQHHALAGRVEAAPRCLLDGGQHEYGLL